MTTLSTNQVDTRASLGAIAGQVSGQEVLLTEMRREGLFRWAPGDQSSSVTADSQQGVYVAPSSAPTGNSGAWVRVDARVLRPEYFGATGDGSTNDTDAFSALSVYMSARGGGVIGLSSNATYLVGKQTFIPGATNTPYVHNPTPIIQFSGLPNAIVIEGNGAKLRCAPGLRYGCFDRNTGAKLSTSPGYTGGTRSTPYEGLIDIQGCTGDISIRNLVLDGSSASLIVGGGWGDAGWQIPHAGLLLINNSGSLLVENVRSHHHAWDGAYFNHLSLPGSSAISATWINYYGEYNGRQGLSFTGGRNVAFTGCGFNHTGRVYNADLGAALVSSPASGLDVEPEMQDHQAMAATWTRCEFYDNAGSGLVGPASDNAGNLEFNGCRFIGTVNYAAYISVAGIRYRDCVFVGPTTGAYSDPMRIRSPYYENCEFTDDPALSPSGIVAGIGSNEPLVTPSAEGSTFVRCRFRCINGMRLPATLGSTAYHDCWFTGQGGSHFTRGRFSGVNTFDGTGAFFVPYDDSGAGHVEGTLSIAGVYQKTGSASIASASYQPGDGAGVAVPVPSARVGDKISLGFSSALPFGVVFTAACVTDGTVSVSYVNASGIARSIPATTLNVQALERAP